MSEGFHGRNISPHVVHVGPVRGHVARVLVRVVDDGVDDVQGDVVHVVDRAVDEGGADAVGAAADDDGVLVVVGVVGGVPLTAKLSTMMETRMQEAPSYM